MQRYVTVKLQHTAIYSARVINIVHLVVVSIVSRIFIILRVVQALSGTHQAAQTAIAAERNVDIKLLELESLFYATLGKIWSGRRRLLFRFDVYAIDWADNGAGSARNAVLNIVKKKSPGVGRNGVPHFRVLDGYCASSYYFSKHPKSDSHTLES